MPRTTSFDLLNEPWIPVETSTGALTEVGLRTAFERASTIRRVLDASPLVTVSLYRLMFAVFHRAHPLATIDDWLDAWDEGTAHEGVSAYLERWKGRFDLFHPEQPFWQVPDLAEEVNEVPWTKLATERNVNNSKVWFDHTVTARQPDGTTPAHAARLLVATQIASVGAGNSGTGYNVNAPVATALMVIPEGRNLAETLLANVRITRHAQEDSAIWERDPVGVQAILRASEDPAASRPFRGVADRLTWLSRAIRIVPPDADGLVKLIRFGAGFRYATIPDDRDPWVPYGTTKDGTWIPRRWSIDKALWRDLHALVVTQENVSNVPLVLRDVGALRDAERLPPVWSILVAGQAADKAKIEGWGLERWSVPHGLVARHETVVGTLRAAVGIVDQVEDRLRRLAFSLARDLLANGPKRRPADVGQAARQLPLATVTWSRLERPYAQFLQRLVNDTELGRAEALRLWNAAIANAIDAGAAATHAAIGRDARAVRAWALFEPRIAQLAKRYRPEKPTAPSTMEVAHG